MVASRPDCDSQRLLRLLSDELSEPDESLVTAHVERCSTCRIQLEELAAEKSLWHEAGRQLHGGQWLDDGTLWLTTRDLESANETDGDSWILSLDFLEPSDNPLMIGRLGAYEIQEVIGSGGFGIVLKGLGMIYLKNPLHLVKLGHNERKSYAYQVQAPKQSVPQSAEVWQKETADRN